MLIKKNSIWKRLYSSTNINKFLMLMLPVSGLVLTKIDECFILHEKKYHIK